jgi:hypothetical protein
LKIDKVNGNCKPVKSGSKASRDEEGKIDCCITILEALGAFLNDPVSESFFEAV